MCRWSDKLVKVGFAVWFAFSQVLFGMPAAYAQSDIIDVEPPLIEHTVVEVMDAGSQQSFVATVVDDAELDNVSLYYRFENDPDYSTIIMKRVSESSTYSVQLPTDPESARSIEYYIQAQDKAGNRTVRGYAFNPLLREINLPGVAAEPPPTQASPSMFESIGKRKTILYVALGVLAVGTVAALLGSGSDTRESCQDNRCLVNVSVEQP